MELRGKRVVVTGGAGFIGSHVCDCLQAQGAQTVVLDDFSVGRRGNLTGAVAAGAQLVRGDVRDAELMRSVLQDAAVVIHMACDNLRASLSRPMWTHDVNATGTLVTCLAALDSSVDRFVYVSSSEAYGSAVQTPMNEDHPLLPTTVYGASKAAGELYAESCMRSSGIGVMVIRPFNCYGPREHSSGTSAEVIPKFAARIRAGLPPVIFGDGEQTRDFTWVEETAYGIVRASACDDLVGQRLNLARGTQVSVREICKELLDICGAASLTPIFEEARPGDVATHWADVSKAREMIGWSPAVSIREGLKRYVAWLDAAGEDAGASEHEAVRNW